MASAIAARQDESELSRRKLVEKSKEFKRTSSEEVRHEVSPLMKAFQSEVGVIRIGQDHNSSIHLSKEAFLWPSLNVEYAYCLELSRYSDHAGLCGPWYAHCRVMSTLVSGWCSPIYRFGWK